MTQENVTEVGFPNKTIHDEMQDVIAFGFMDVCDQLQIIRENSASDNFNNFQIMRSKLENMEYNVTNVPEYYNETLIKLVGATIGVCDFVSNDMKCFLSNNALIDFYISCIGIYLIGVASTMGWRNEYGEIYIRIK